MEIFIAASRFHDAQAKVNADMKAKTVNAFLNEELEPKLAELLAGLQALNERLAALVELIEKNEKPTEED